MEPRACNGASRCHHLAGIVTDVLLTLIRESARDGQVPLAVVERIADLVRGGTVSLDEAFIRHEESCRKDHTRPKGNVGARSNPFQRLIVRPFEHLLTGNPPPFPRPYLASYFEFVEKSLGPLFESFDNQSRAIIQGLLVIHGNNLTWDHFYGDQRTQAALGTALKLIVQVMGTPEGQRLWHSCMMRPVGDLPAPEVPQTNRIRQALIDTASGMATAAN